MDKIAVIGIGNPFRGDDGAGWAVIDELIGKVPKQVNLHKIRGDMGNLLEYFENYEAVYLIDACIGDAEAGSWQRLNAFEDSLILERAQTSTHGLSIKEAVSMAKALSKLPTKLIIYAINGDQYNMSDHLSPPVEKVIPTVAQNLLKELQC